jgi:transcription initiation factor TFIIF subunit alpha
MATPSDPGAVRTPAGPDGTQAMKIRRPRAADPLVRPRKKPATRPPGTVPPARLPANGTAATRPKQTANTVPNALLGPQTVARPRSLFATGDATVNGFGGPPLEPYVDYPLVTTKRAWRESLKHHVAKFASKKAIDPRDEYQFTRPVRLQRRDPRAKGHEPDNVKTEGVNKAAAQEGGIGVDDVDREDLEARKAAREREREENLAQIAPSVATAQKRPNAPKQKTQHVAKADMTPEETARARIKYEEALPWHLEDFDNKNTWAGNYEAALSEIYAMFVLEDTGNMRMVPVDKWYKFSARNQFKALTIEEAEKMMAKKIKDPRWFMEKQQQLAEEKELEKYAKHRKVYRGKQSTPAVGGGLEGEELDYEEDRFADDEEHDGLFDEDEEAKAAEKRIKQDQLKANIFNLKEEKDYDEEELKEKKEREARKILGKQVRKALQRREKNYDYSSGSDVNPYSDDEVPCSLQSMINFLFSMAAEICVVNSISFPELRRY